MQHRDLITLLHEIGHAIQSEDDMENKGPNHSPAFARILLELYNRYAGFKLDYLLVSANSYNLLGDLKSNQSLFTTRKHPDL